MSVYYIEKSKKWKVAIWYKNQRRATRTFPNKTMAEKFERKTLQELEHQSLTGNQAKDYLYSEVFQYWYLNAKPRKSESSLEKDIQMHRDFIEPILGRVRVSEIKPFHFEQIVTYMLKRELSKSSVNKVIQHFKAVFNHSFNNETIARNPAKSFKQLRLEQKEMDYLSQEELDQLLTYTSQKYLGTERWKQVFYLTLFLTGARLGEVLGLEWNRINFTREVILIGQMWCSKENKLILTTKGRKDRTIPLNSYLRKELGAIKNYSKGSFVFSDTEGRPIDASNFRSRNWDKDFESAGIRKIRIHDARHTYASIFMTNGGSLYDLKELLGHTSIKTTERYAHLSQKHLANAKDIIKLNIDVCGDILEMKKNEPRSIRTLENLEVQNVL